MEKTRCEPNTFQIAIHKEAKGSLEHKSSKNLLTQQWKNMFKQNTNRQVRVDLA